MFKVLNARKRRVISPTTVAASVAAHILLLGGAVYAATNDTAPSERVAGIVELPPLPTEPPPEVEPVEPAPPPPQPAQPDAPAPAAGETLQLEAPAEVPEAILPEPVGTVPVDETKFSGIGRVGDYIGRPAAEPAAPAGDAHSEPGEVYVPDEGDVEERPVLNRDGLSRTMERFYPSIMRDSRTPGRVLVQLIVEADGTVRPGSAQVVEATHAAFSEATLRAVERFRFRPAMMAGVPVPVRVTIPISWTVPR